jgi:hypothetical protein
MVFGFFLPYKRSIMKTLSLAIGLLVLTGLGACRKKQTTQPAVVVHVISASYPPTEENYVVYTASIELKRTDETYYEKKYVSGTGQVTFEDLKPGEYWINEQTTRDSHKFMLGAEETQEITFYLP